MPRQRILVVDDDPKAVEMVRAYLERAGYQALAAYDGQSALELARIAQPDLVVLDLMLPQLSGLEVCRLLRQELETPIIMLTARAAEDDKQIGLDLGADDFIVKPFSPRQLIDRIGSLLRVVEQQATIWESNVSIGHLTVSFEQRAVYVDGQPVVLTPSEFRLLCVLVRGPGRVFSRLELLEKVFGSGLVHMESNVDMVVENVRRKIGLGLAGPIKSVYGGGYKLEVAS